VLVVGAVVAAGSAGDRAVEQARRGQLEGVPAGSLRVVTPLTGPLLVTAGGLLVMAAGVETVRRGPTWPALGAAFRAPPDRPVVADRDSEPPWEGD